MRRDLHSLHCLAVSKTSVFTLSLQRRVEALLQFLRCERVIISKKGVMARSENETRSPMSKNWHCIYLTDA